MAPFIWLIVAAIAGFIFAFLGIAFQKIFFSFDTAFVKELYTGFFGAFFALLFTRLAEAFKKIYDRQVSGYNALVDVEHRGNRLLTINSDNLFVLRDFRKAASEAISKNAAILYPNRFHQYDINDDLKSFADIDFINEVFSLNTDLFKMNSSLEAWNRQYEIAQASLLQKQIAYPEYKFLISSHVNRLAELEKFLESLTDDIIVITAKARILMRRKPLFTYVVHLAVLNKRSNNFDELVARELATAKEEMAKIQKESAERISKIIGS